MIDYSFTNHAHRQLKKLPVNIQQHIIKKIRHYLATENPLHFSDTIQGERGKVYRFRIGDYRVIFDWEGKHILITKVSIRSSAY